MLTNFHARNITSFKTSEYAIGKSDVKTRKLDKINKKNIYYNKNTSTRIK